MTSGKRRFQLLSIPR